MANEETGTADGWVDAEAVLPHIMTPRSFVSGTREPRRLSVKYLLHGPTRRLRAEVRFDGDCEGPPGCVHGAAIAGLFDEGLGLLTWYVGHPAATCELNVKYRRFVRLGSSATLEGTIEEADGLLVVARGVLRSADGEHASARVVFFELEEQAVEEMRAKREAQSADDPDVLARVRDHREAQAGR
jgi:acyl-coenzyme A thioesterase PaaI-like protein